MSISNLQCAQTRSGLGIAGKDDIEIIMKKISELEKTNKEKTDMLLALLRQLDIITQSSIQKNSEKQEDRINTLEARVKELEDEVKFLKTLPTGLMETLGYKKI
jgi:hypothetical protein